MTCAQAAYDSVDDGEPRSSDGEHYAACSFALLPSHLPEYRELGTDYDERVLPSIVNEVLKSVVAQYNVAADHAARIGEPENPGRIARSRQEFNLILDDVSITHLSFSEEYTAAVEEAGRSAGGGARALRRR